MKSKLHFGILILLITVVVRFLETPVTPNQQIVVQFSNAQINENDAERTITAITAKLQSIGVEQISVGQDQNGHLKITYYSSKDAKEIQTILLGNQNVRLSYGLASTTSKERPTDKKTETYKLDVSDIKETTNANDWDFDGVIIVEHNTKTDRFNKLEKQAFSYQFHSEIISQRTRLTISSCAQNVFTNYHSYTIPEVRAGPLV